MKSGYYEGRTISNGLKLHQKKFKWDYRKIQNYNRPCRNQKNFQLRYLYCDFVT